MVVHRVREPQFPKDVNAFVGWVATMNADMRELGVELCERFDFDLVHSHDWLVAGAAERLARRDRPAVADDGPRHRVRSPPGVGAEPSAVAHPRASSGRWCAGPTA